MSKSYINISLSLKSCWVVALVYSTHLKTSESEKLRDTCLHHHHHFHLTSVFSHLGWGWTGNDSFPHPSIRILYHMFLHSQQVHIIYHTLTPLFPRPSTGYRLPISAGLPPPPHTTPPPSVSFISPNCLSLLFLNRNVFNSTHLCHLTATPPILPPHSCLINTNLLTFLNIRDNAAVLETITSLPGQSR